MKKNTYILGIDGGGTSTNAVLFDSYGNTLCENSSDGSNLYVYKEQAIQKIFNLLNIISKKSKISLEEISAIGIGVAGVSDLNHRELLLKELDRLNLSNISLICSDTEAAYHVLCPSGEGILVSVGTGVICMGKSKEENVRIAGKGHDKGDVGSGYWIGNKIIKTLILNQNSDLIISPLICLLLIITIGISHGSLDHSKGKKLLNTLKITNMYFFYLSYIFIAVLVIILWVMLPSISLILFLALFL